MSVHSFTQVEYDLTTEDKYMSSASPSFSQAMKSTEKVTPFTPSSFEGICCNCPSSLILTNYNHLIHFQKTNTYIKKPCQRQQFLHELKTLQSSVFYTSVTITLLLVMNINRTQAKIYVSYDKSTCNCQFNLKCSQWQQLFFRPLQLRPLHTAPLLVLSSPLYYSPNYIIAPF